MPEINNGRRVRFYVAPVEYDEEGNPQELLAEDMIPVVAMQELLTDDEAEAAEVKARDLEYAVNVLGQKTSQIEFDKLLEVDPEAADIEFLVARYDDGAAFWVLLTTNGIDEEGTAALMIGCLFGMPEKIPDTGPVPVHLTIKPAEVAA